MCILRGILILIGASALLGHAAHAQVSGLSSQSSDPLEITADGALEWQRAQKRFIANQNALARQGEASVQSDRLTAQYREGGDTDSAGMQIWQVEANGNVVLKSRDSEAFGEKAVYNLDDGLATMTGGNLKLVMPEQTVTASDKFEYFVEEGRLNAIGNATAIRPKAGGGQDTLKADTLSAVMKNDAQGKRVLDTLEAKDNVVITTPSEVITGAYGIYRASTNTAELTGGVTIKRGPNTLEGNRAEVDMNTDTSRIFGSGGTNRVKGVFYPGSNKSP